MNAFSHALTLFLLQIVLIACTSPPNPTATSLPFPRTSPIFPTVTPMLFPPRSIAPTSAPMLFAPAPGSPIPISGGPNNVAIGDVDKDGKPDLLVLSRGGISVLIGNGDGQFRTTRSSPIQLPNHPSEIALDDINADGNLDVALAAHDSYGVMLLLGNGQGSFALAPNSPIIMKDGKQPHTHGLAIGDLNGDKKLDLVTVNSNPDNDVSLVFGDARGGFVRAPGSPFGVGPSPYPLSLADLNADGNLDIIATNTATGPDWDKQLESSRALTLLFGDGKGGFRQSRVPLRTVAPWFAAVGNVNNDPSPDILATHHERPELTVLLGDGKGGFTEKSGSPFDLGRAAWHIAVIDVNRDGNADIVAAAGDGVRVMLGDGSGGFKLSPGSPFATGRGAWRLAIGDVNGDGKPDVVTSNLESDSVSVMLGQ